MKTLPTQRRVALAGVAAAMLALAVLQGCSVSDQLLSATDPDLIKPADLNSPAGAEALRIGALARFRDITAGDNGNGNESTWLFGGLLVDEWGTSSTFVQNDETDERRISLDNSTVTYAFRKLHRVRTAVDQAIPALKKYNPTANVSLAEMYLARGFAEMQLASDFCNGIPLSDASTDDGIIAWGAPNSVAKLFDIAGKTLDSGLAIIGSPTADSALTIKYALLVTRARTLLGNDSVAAAGALVAAVPTTFSYNHTFLASSGSNAIWGQPFSGRRYLVGDSLEGNSHNILVKNAIPFFSAKDPRVPATYTITVKSGKADTTKSQDGLTLSRTTTLYGQETAVAVANGIDARLIEAEAKLRAGDAAGMLAILNTLRATKFTLGAVTYNANALPALVDPGTTATQVNLLFREKAFWTFSRGQRLGDMRRLIRYYGRTEDTVYPEGNHYRGGTYGPDVNLPIPIQEQNNPLADKNGCTDRNP